MEDIILLGIGGHAHSVVDSIEQAGKYRILGFLDTSEKQDCFYKDYRVISTDDALESYYLQGVRNAFVTIGYVGNGTVRNMLYKRMKLIGYTIPNIVDITASVASDVSLDEGIFIGKGAVVNSNAKIGKMCIINTKAVVEHDCYVGEYSHVAVGSILCGNTSVGVQSLIGANATVIQGIEIGNNVIVGAGTTITSNIDDNMIRYGNIEKQRDIKG